MRTPDAIGALAVCAALALAACGGDDDDTSAPDGTEPAPADADTDTDTETDTGAPAEGGGGDLGCDDVFSMAEVEGWFGEPAELTEESNDQLGQLVCTWETIEDPADSEDLAFTLITAQVYSGDPIGAENFVDQDIFDETTTLEGIGDLAFYESGGGTYYFLDEPFAGVFGYTEADLGDVDAPKRQSPEAIEDIFRLFHERVTGG